MTKTESCCKGWIYSLTVGIRGFCLFLAVPWYSYCNWGEVGFTTGFTVFLGGKLWKIKHQEGCNLDTFIEGLKVVQGLSVDLLVGWLEKTYSPHDGLMEESP